MKDRMLAGEHYIAEDAELHAELSRAEELLERFNRSRHAEQRLREQLLSELLGSVGAGVTIKPTFRCDYGSQISVGAATFINYDCVFLDVAAITIGRDCQIGPRVQLLTPTHPLDADQRRRGWESARPITVADNVWLGGGAIIGPGVSIGADTVVGAGAVVTRDLPGGVVAVGCPARILRPIDASDRLAIRELEN